MSSLAKQTLAVLAVIIPLGTIWWVSRPEKLPQSDAPALETSHPRLLISKELADQVSQIEAKERVASDMFWSKELLAQECGRTFEQLWDAVRASTNKLVPVAAFPFQEILLPGWSEPKAFPHGIFIREPLGKDRMLSSAEWRDLVENVERRGWELETAEFRQNAFDADQAGQPKRSRYFFSAHLINRLRMERAILEGDLRIDWGPRDPQDPLASVRRVNATGLTLKTRVGEPPFRLILAEEITPPENSNSIDPLIVYDLDGDGIPEITLVAKNLVYRRQADGHYLAEKLCMHPIPYIWTAVVADFDGDGVADLLCDKYEGIYLFKGSPQGKFDQPPRLVWSPTLPVQNSMVMTCGDIDGDGDLDVFLAQYEEPYANGRTPTPYYNANDGNPSYLLLNDGHGNLRDATAVAGLTKNRWRRTYSASFADLNGDGALDLLVVSDFAGLDLYKGDGKGHFAERTRQWVADSQGFGMAHALADFNRDGRPDLLMIGMTSPTVSRLEHLGLWREDVKENPTMRTRMTFGNRLYIADEGVKPATSLFVQNALSDSIAHSGWSWGCGAFDFDNDGFPDVYIANGLESNQSVRDYEPEFWLHDRYVGEGTNSAAARLYFKGKFGRTREREYSYGGYEKNRLYLNLGGTNFLEAAYLMGAALEEDCRNVVADDLDGDGRVDLLVCTFEIWPKKRQVLRVFRNELKEVGNWIGFRLRGNEARKVIGLPFLLQHGGSREAQVLVTGDSYRSQHSTSLHFGLGARGQEQLQLRIPGTDLPLKELRVNAYQDLPSH